MAFIGFRFCIIDIRGCRGTARKQQRTTVDGDIALLYAGLTCGICRKRVILHIELACRNHREVLSGYRALLQCRRCTYEGDISIGGFDLSFADIDFVLNGIAGDFLSLFIRKLGLR